MTREAFNVLFLCTGNSARSIMAECILNRNGAGSFVAYSAGSAPRGEVHPRALHLLQSLGYETQNLRSKSWNEFIAPGAPRMDFVFTVCGDAADEICPIWPGQPLGSHWGVPDPAAAQGTDAERTLAFVDAYRMLSKRISLFLALPMKWLDKGSLQKRLDEIGASSGSDA